ncbi:AlpA family transcriptional regulator [Jannaschia sp. M317]|uniref:helix-turn-helix transcriptional regulator n=1 Tax=Jannaschia sp. M317 TaxID=2867011 RepID=UPI0021A8B109|nr:helix-turn-helix domain-containing protein [Jannaschia sp. M317]
MRLVGQEPQIDPNQMLTEVQVADLVCQSVRTLQKWRVTGQGPAFYKLGQSVRYRYAEVQGWVASRRVKHTTEAQRFACGDGRQAGRDARACAGARPD